MLKDNKLYIYKALLLIIFLIIIYNLYNIMIKDSKIYKDKLNIINNKIIYKGNPPRGLIYDRNMNLLVGNISKPIIIYKKVKNTTKKDEIELAKYIVNYIDIDYSKVSDMNLKEYYYLTNNLDHLITNEELIKYKNHLLNTNDLYNLKISRIKEEDIYNMSDNDRKAAYMYYLMNNGYRYQEKIIKEESVTDQEYSYFIENKDNLKGFTSILSHERYNPYNDTLKTVLGSVGKIRKEDKDYYLNKGYSLDDDVGISYIEKQYDDILKGTKGEYKKINNDTLIKIKDPVKGTDIVLEIDIKLQEEIDKIIKEEIINTKREINTEYFNKAYVIIMDSKSGGILAFNGLEYIENTNTFKDISINNIMSSYTPGSIVKGASMMTAYVNNALEIGDIKTDECIKIKSSPKKCSSYQVGTLNDVDALTHSSNIYQFKLAIKLGKGKYKYDYPLSLDMNAFDLYRNKFKEFGLGALTEIDLENEQIGLIPDKKDTNLLLNLAIGQYDTYTPIELAQYMNTFANKGKRIAPHFLKEYNNQKYETRILNIINDDIKYFNRIEEGFREVIRIGTGYKMLGDIKNGAGKTGTSESFIDTNNDNIIDTKSITNTFSGYFPYNDPKITITIVTPDVSVFKNNNYYISPVNRRISKKISNYYNANYN